MSDVTMPGIPSGGAFGYPATTDDPTYDETTHHSSVVGTIIHVEDEGIAVVDTATLNFVGAGVTATDVGGVGTVTIPAAAPAANTVHIQDEGVAVDTAGTINFTGAGVTATDVGGIATVDVPGGAPGSTIDVQDEGVAVNVATTLNFVGAGVTATDAGGGVADVTIPASPPPANTIDVEDEGVAVNTAATMNFVGAGVTATDVGGVATVTVPGPVGGLLDAVSYNPNPAQLLLSTNAVATDADAANLAIAFVAPASGKVLVTLRALAYADASNHIAWNLREGGADIAGSSEIASIGIQGVCATTLHVVTGLVPGSAHTFTWGIARTAGAGSAGIIVGQATNDDAGQACMTVTAIP